MMRGVLDTNANRFPRTLGATWVLAVLTTASLVMGSSARADTIQVTTTDDASEEDFDCSLREAIQAVNDGDAGDDGCAVVDDGDDGVTIVVPAGTYTLALDGGDDDANATGDLDLLDVVQTVTISGAGQESTILDGAEQSRVLDILAGAGDVAFGDLTITGGFVSDQNGGGIRIGARTVVLTRVSVSDNHIDSCSGSIDGSGGGIASLGTLTLIESTVANNSAGAGVPGVSDASGCPGGGLTSAAELLLIDTTVIGNAAGSGATDSGGEGDDGGDGGGIYDDGGALTIRGGLIMGNQAGDGGLPSGDHDGGYGGHGGGIGGSGYDLRIERVTIIENSAGVGSGSSGMGTVSGEGGTGGGIAWSGCASIVIDETEIRGNTAGDGGTALGTSSDGEPGGEGGGAHLSCSLITIRGSAVVGNTAGDGGDGLGSGGSGAYGGSGGGLWANFSELTLMNSTVSGNAAGSFGVDALGEPGVAESRGGGLFLLNGDADIAFSTISGNASDEEGGGLWTQNDVVVINSILSDNTATAAGPDCLVAENGTITSAGNNLFGDPSDCPVALEITDTVGADPVLGSVADNGGSTSTVALLPGSPAIDSGTCLDTDDELVVTDQRGLSRPRGRTCDIGAYERTDETLLESEVEPAGDNCEYGGQRIQSGIDLDVDGTLDADEVDSVVYVCNGADGSDGAAGGDGTPALFTPSDIEPGDARCPAGGVALDVGLDANRDGVLGADEVSDTVVLCNGEQGPAGPAGTDGRDAPEGTGDGAAPISCTASQAGGSTTITCGDGSTAQLTAPDEGCCATAGASRPDPIVGLAVVLIVLAGRRRRAHGPTRRRRSGKMGAGLFALSIGLVGSASAVADTITVTTTADVIEDNDDCSLREAILEGSQAPANDDCTSVPDEASDTTIVVPGGTYELSLIEGDDDDDGLEGDLDFDFDGTTLQGSTDATDPTIITLADSATFRLIHIHDGSQTLSDLTLTGGLTPDTGGLSATGGAGIRVQGETTEVDLRRVRIVGNEVTTCADETLDGGAGIWNASDELRVIDSVVEDNIGGPGVPDATVARGCPGGGIYSEGTLRLENTVVSGNVAGQGAINENTNAARGGHGGGIYATDDLTVIGGSITDNQAGAGAAAPTDGDGGNGGNGGGIALVGDLVMEGATISDNRGGDGADGDGTGDGGTGGHGGGIWVNSGSVDLLDSVVRGNASGDGGSATGADGEGRRGGYGGGLYLGDGSAMPRLERVAVVENSAGAGGDGMGTGTGGNGGNGGGIVNQTALLTLINVTVSGNTAGLLGTGSSQGGGAQGGGINNGQNSALDLSFTTITGNATERLGGGVRGNDVTIRMVNSIISGNSAGEEGPDCLTVGTTIVDSLGHNLFDDDTDCDINLDFTDQVGVDPLLGDLVDNGGGTPTRAPSAGSPAIDAGICADVDGATVFLDQRRLPRPGGANCDIGAYERADTALLESAAEPAGVNCADGGYRIQAGLDLDGDGALDAEEVEKVLYVCHGADGAGGQEGADPPVPAFDAAPIDEGDPRCPAGGMAVDVGLDTDGNGTLDDDEVGDTVIVCNGEPGPAGQNGQNGRPAPDGTGQGTGVGASSCSVVDHGNGTATITCDDGTETQFSLVGDEGCCATAGGRPPTPLVLLVLALAALVLHRRRHCPDPG